MLFIQRQLAYKKCFQTGAITFLGIDSPRIQWELGKIRNDWHKKNLTEIMEKWGIRFRLGPLLEGPKTSFTFWARRLESKSRRRRRWRGFWIGYWWQSRSHLCYNENGDWHTRYKTTDCSIRNKICELKFNYWTMSLLPNHEPSLGHILRLREASKPHIGLAKGSWALIWWLDVVKSVFSLRNSFNE